MMQQGHGQPMMQQGHGQPGKPKPFHGTFDKDYGQQQQPTPHYKP